MDYINTGELFFYVIILGILVSVGYFVYDSQEKQNAITDYCDGLNSNYIKYIDINGGDRWNHNYFCITHINTTLISGVKVPAEVYR